MPRRKKRANSDEGPAAKRKKISNKKTTTDGGMYLCKYSYEGNVVKVQELLEDGTLDVNEGDYDKRTALHLAAAEGHTAVVEFLLKHGAHVNPKDRWGQTPYCNAVAKRHLEVVNILRKSGAVVQQESRSDMTASLCQGCASGDMAGVEELLKDETVDLNAGDEDGRTPLHLAAAEGQCSIASLLVSRGAKVEIRDKFGNTPMMCAVNGARDDMVECLLSHGASRKCRPSLHSDNKEIEQHMREVHDLLTLDGTFSTRVIDTELSWFYNQLRLRGAYFRKFAPKATASHIMSFISAKRVSSTHDDDIRFSSFGDGKCFILCSSANSSVLNAEGKLASAIARIQRGNGGNNSIGMSHFLSGGPYQPYGGHHLGLYIVESIPFEEQCLEAEASLDKVGHASMIAHWPESVRERYQEMLTMGSGRLALKYKVYPLYHDGTIPIMFVFRSGVMGSIFRQITELLLNLNISCPRKYMQSFANGVCVVSVYIHPRGDAEIALFASLVGLLYVVPPTPGLKIPQLTTQEYAYAVMVKKFAYYFLSQENDAFAALLAATKDDPSLTSSLLDLRLRMRTELVSEQRVEQCMAAYPTVIKAMYVEFAELFHPETGKTINRAKLLEGNHERLTLLIEQEATKDLDRTILMECVTFNRHVLKTNFYKTTKSALSLRLDPAYLPTSTYPDRPFGIFLIMSNEFTGFHVRFADVARGGIRLIRSRGVAGFAKNNETVFTENYNLAHTQNKKNKDIPEFGSKGTILLSLESQGAGRTAFRKYVSGVFDIILKNDEIVDHFGAEEILFLGPDEGTADLMEWAALYAKKRGYAYWKAITTGKPPSLGGIPHDVYGMTTRSVHTFCTETLKKKNWDESACTKLQTGGPDGDLGSNEILISCDRTTSIVDGSGVIHDPKGLDRTELQRLARNRQMVNHFDRAKLSKDGFLVLLEERDVTLPCGDVIRSGLSFRNEYHLSKYSTADLFVPCGGRPEAVHKGNVQQLIEDGTPRFKVVVEGANLFFTQDARQTLEAAGVVLFKDASANKGGVTSSSLEVMAAMALNDGEFTEHMCQADGELPAFYREYVEEVQGIIEENARLEFHAIWKEHEKTGVHRHVITDTLSNTINVLNLEVRTSSALEDSTLRRRVLETAIPRSLQKLVGGVDAVVARLPEAYIVALFSSALSSRYVYNCGMEEASVAGMLKYGETL